MFFVVWSFNRPIELLPSVTVLLNGFILLMEMKRFSVNVALPLAELKNVSFPFNFLQDVTSVSHSSLLSLDERYPQAKNTDCRSNKVSFTVRCSAGYEAINNMRCVIKMWLCCFCLVVTPVHFCFFSVCASLFISSLVWGESDNKGE